ncbi:MAG: hypothetical protein QOG49_1086 [Frankiaceae bacterium]|nr:hypothetical protein [Frankiaceae bacterium]
MSARPDALSRRSLLKRSGGVALAVAAGSVVRPAAAAAAPATDRFVQVFLRGGMDGLSAVAPAGDPAYAAARPGISVPASLLTQLDSTFGLHPALAALLPMWQAGELAFVHSVGNPQGDRSHFESQDAIDCGAPVSSAVRTGWLARHLIARGQTPAALRAVGIGETQNMSLKGQRNAITLRSLANFKVGVGDHDRVAYERAIRLMHSGFTHPIAGTGIATLSALGEVRSLNQPQYATSPLAAYPDSNFGKALRNIAQCAKGPVGLEAATIDISGWDHHTDLGNHGSGQLAGKLTDLAAGLAALRTDLGQLWAETTVVVISEFGRRVEENGDGGVDHGSGGLMMVMGGGIRGGKIYGDWRGVQQSALDHGDLPVTTDWRNVYAELVSSRLGNGNALGSVFPGLKPSFLGLANPR